MTVKRILAAGVVGALATSCGTTAASNTRPSTTATTFVCDPVPCSTPTTRRPRPRLSLDCGLVASVGKRAGFGHTAKQGSAPLNEWGIDYGDGRRYVTHDAATAEREAFWHMYQQSGSYTVRAWVAN